MEWKRAVRPLTPKKVRSLYPVAQHRLGATRAWIVERVSPPRDLGTPLPPPLLRQRVHRTFDVRTFLDIGRELAGDIRSAVASSGDQWGSFDEVLDFGCGCGRVLRHYRDELPGAKVHGCDIDAVAISWCQRNLSFAEFRTNGAMPPFPYDEQQFDFVYATSVFTHLNEEMQLAWLEELRRVTRPGALLLLTTHGSKYADRISQSEEGDFLYSVGATGRGKGGPAPRLVPDVVPVEGVRAEHVVAVLRCGALPRSSRELRPGHRRPAFPQLKRATACRSCP